MEIPILTKFVNGLKLFLASKRLKWITLLFMLGTTLITVFERLTTTYIPGLQSLVVIIGMPFPIYFLLVIFMSLIGKQEYVASSESYKTSLKYTIVWMIISAVVTVIFWVIAWPIVLTVLLIGFLSWVGFQAYFSTRSSLSYASAVDVGHRSKIFTVLLGFLNILNYVILAGAFIVSAIMFSAFLTPPFWWALLGLLIATGFNFLNGLIITWERNKPTADNLSLLGLFISAYSAYFIYNVMKGVDLNLDLVSIAISIFFILYTMSGIGSSLASRAEMDTRFRISKELAAALTYFLASAYIFVDTAQGIILADLGTDPATAAPLGDAIKLLIFPLVALLMEIRYIYGSRKIHDIPETKEEEMPVVPVEEVDLDEEEQVEEPAPEPATESEPTSEEPETEDVIEEPEEETETEEEEEPAEDTPPDW